MIAEIDITQIVVSIVTAGGVVATSYFSFRSHQSSKQVNDAVNNVHESGGLRIYDLALKNSEQLGELVDWKRSYKDSPWKDGDGVREWLDEHNETIKKISAKVES